MKLSEQQQESILREWNDRPDDPPSLLTLTKIAFPDLEKVDGRCKEGKLVKVFLAENGLRARPSNEYKPKGKTHSDSLDKEVFGTIDTTRTRRQHRLKNPAARTAATRHSASFAGIVVANGTRGGLVRRGALPSRARSPGPPAGLRGASPSSSWTSASSTWRSAG